MIVMIKKVVGHLRNIKKKKKFQGKLDADHYYLEIHVVDHCNLKCKGCSHYSPIADEWYISLTDYEKQIKTAAALFSGRIKEFHILGGEPLLHPQIDRIMEITRRYFKEDRILVVTNGLLIKKQSEDFWSSMYENRIILLVTQYPCVKNFDEIIDYVRRKKIDVYTYATKEEFSFRGMSEKGNNNWKEEYHRCPNGGYCLQIRNGKIYPCAAIAYVDILNQKFGTHFLVDKKSYLVLDDIKSAGEITRFRREAKEVCKYCSIDSREKFKWTTSRFEREEWIIDE